MGDRTWPGLGYEITGRNCCSSDWTLDYQSYHEQSRQNDGKEKYRSITQIIPKEHDEYHFENSSLHQCIDDAGNSDDIFYCYSWCSRPGSRFGFIGYFTKLCRWRYDFDLQTI